MDAVDPAVDRVHNILASIKSEMHPEIEFSWASNNQNDINNWRIDASSPGSSTSEAASDRWSKERKAWILVELEKGNLLLAPFRENDDFFSRVVKPNGQKVAVQCNLCKTLLSPNAGGQYNYHRTACPQRQITKETHIPASPYPITATIKKSVIQSIAKLCAIDFLPFSIVEGPGFRSFINDVLLFGFNAGTNVLKNKEKYSAPQVDDYLPNKDAVDRFIDDYITIKLPAFNELVQKSVTSNGGSISLKALNINGKNFVQVGLHFIDEFWRLHGYTIDIIPCVKTVMPGLTAALSKRGLNFLDAHTKAQSELFIEHGVTLVENMGHISFRWSGRCEIECMAEKLTNWSLWIICPKKLTPEVLKPEDKIIKELYKVRETIDDVEVVIKELNKTLASKNTLAASILKELEKPHISQKKLVELFLELIEICHQPELLIDLRIELSNKEVRAKFDNIIDNLRILRDFVTAMGSMDIAIKNLQKEHEPTLNSVLLELNALKKEFKAVEQNAESATLKALGTVGYRLIDKQLLESITDFHTHAFILDPAHKNLLRFLLPSAEGFQKAKEAFRASVLAIRPPPIEEPSIEQDFDELDSFDGLPPSASQNFCIDPIEIEIKNYLGLSKTQAENYESVLDFWKANESTFPTIAKLAKRVLCIPACVTSENGASNLLNSSGKETPVMDQHTIEKLVNTVALQKFSQIMV